MFLYGFGFHVKKKMLGITHSEAAQTYNPNTFSGKVNKKGYIYIISPLGGKVSMEVVLSVSY